MSSWLKYSDWGKRAWKHLEISSVSETSPDFSMKENSGKGLRNAGQWAK